MIGSDLVKKLTNDIYTSLNHVENAYGKLMITMNDHPTVVALNEIIAVANLNVNNIDDWI